MDTSPVKVGRDDVLVENLRLKRIIEEQQRQIDAMVVGAGMAQSLQEPPAKPSSAENEQVLATPVKPTMSRQSTAQNPQFLALLDVAQRYRLCTPNQKQMMLSLVDSGRFTAQYYIDMWLRRLTDLSPQAAKAAQKALSEGASGRTSSVPARPRVSTGITPTSAVTAPSPVSLCGSAPVLHRARGKNGAEQISNGAHRIRVAADDAAGCGQSALDVNVVYGVKPDVKMESCFEDGQVEIEKEWDDAPKELLRRATRTFVQDDTVNGIGEMDSSGEWRRKGHTVELTRFQCSGQSGQSGVFSLQRDLYDRLRPYQRAGVAWMAHLYQSRKGGILADEMGLGKTVQACGLLSGIKKTGATHVLIIVPVTLLDQWDREASKWCPEWRVYTYHGSPAQRVRALQGVMTPLGGILLTSYAVLKNADDRLLQVAISETDSFGIGGEGKAWADPCVEEPRESREPSSKKMRSSAQKATHSEKKSCKRPWDLVICDEAHVMRNISTLLGRHLRSLVSQSRVLLTGTPVQNALQDLWSLMDFAQPGLLGNHTTFVKNVSDPIDKGSVRGASPFAVQLKKHLCEQLWDLVNPHLLRRTKESVGLLGDADAADESRKGHAALPPKLETVIWLMPTDEQVKATKKLLEKSDVIQEANSNGKMGLAVFRAIALLKRLCNHPALGLPLSQPSAWQDFLSEAIGKAKGKRKACSIGLSGATNPSTPAGGEADKQEGEDDDVRAGRAVEMLLRKLPRDIESLTSQSAKLRCLAKLLPALASQGHRTLIFSQGLKMMDLVELCILKKLGITYLRIDGSTDVQSRADRVQQFQTQPDAFQCMLLTTSVGGYGLNLTGADRVVLLDPAWNPAVDAQAVERVYRIGQQREVRVYRLVMSGLIEDKMFRLQVFKMGLTKTALDAKQQHRYFTSAEIRGLFEWTDPSQGETRKLLREKHGEDQEEVARKNAQQDGSNNGWFDAGPAIGLSNFSVLYSCLAQGDEEPDEECEVQVAEMKANLGRVDESIHRTKKERHAVEDELKAAQLAIQEAGKKIAETSASHAKAQVLAKKRQVELTKACRHETAAMQHLEKVMRRRVAAREAKMNADEVSMQADHEAIASGRSMAEALASWRDAAGTVDAAFQVAQEAVSMVHSPSKDTQVEVVTGKVKVQAVQKSLERAQKAWDATREGWATLEAAETALLQVESVIDTCHKNRSKSESNHEKAVQRVEALRDTMTNAMSALVEAGVAFSESLQCVQGHTMSASALKTVQQSAKSKFRQVSAAWIRTRQLQEAWLKTSHAHRRLTKKVAVAKASCAEADAWMETVENEHQDALASEEHERSSRLACEQALLEAEALRSSAEVENAGQKCRRSECQASLSVAKAKLKPAKAAEKEASAGRITLLNHYTKADKGHIKLELEANATSAKEALSAVRALQAEKYDVNQVEEAYQQCQAKKKQRTDTE